jgi:hypothetical protein
MPSSAGMLKSILGTDMSPKSIVDAFVLWTWYSSSSTSPVDGHDPLRLGGHVSVVKDVILELDRLLVQLGDDKQFFLFHYLQPNVRLPHGR